MSSSAGAALAALVSISVAPDVPAELSSAAIRSCDTALGAGKCRLEADTTDDAAKSPKGDDAAKSPKGDDAAKSPEGGAEWRATITASDPGFSTVRIDVQRSSAHSEPETRELTFSPDDAPRERWASVGVVIAALIVAGSREPEPAPAKPVTAPPPELPKSLPLAIRSPARESHLLRLDLRALIARRTGEGVAEVGAELGASVLPEGGPWFAAVSIAGAKRLGAQPAVAWFDAALGPGVRLGSPSALIAGEFRAMVVGEYWRFEASEPGRSEASGRFRVGGLLGADALWALHQKWILSVGVETLVAVPRIRVDLRGTEMEKVPEYGALIAAGLRFRP